MQSAMNEAATRAVMNQMFFDPLSADARHHHQFVILVVSRENIVTDTLRELSHYNSSDLKKPLRVSIIHHVVSNFSFKFKITQLSTLFRAGEISRRRSRGCRWS